MRTSQPSAPGPRDRLLTATVGLLSRQGYEATAVKQITTEAAAPMGSFYFHFPGGKEELAVAAMREGADGVDALLRDALQRAAAPEDALADCALALADVLSRSDWLDGCPIATTALESIGRSETLRDTAAQAFERWIGTISRYLIDAGVPGDVARPLASTTLALLEGAELLARVRADAEPLHHAADALRLLARDALGRDALTRDDLGRDDLGRDALGRDAFARDALARDDLARDALARDALGQAN